MKAILLTRRKAIGLVAASMCSPAFVVGMIGVTPFAAAAVSIPPEFLRQLTRAKLTLDTSKLHDFDPARVLPNSHFAYDLGAKHSRTAFELRYALRDVAPMEREINSKRRAPRSAQSIVLPFETVLPSFAETGVMNMSQPLPQGPAMTEPKPFDADAVRAEFGADWGFVCRFTPRSTFAKYPAGGAVVIYRHDVRTLAYIVQLYGTDEGGKMPDDTFELYRRTFYALRFEGS
jgi:hypothetical protein